jgi:hypothetical protein
MTCWKDPLEESKRFLGTIERSDDSGGQMTHGSNTPIPIGRSTCTLNNVLLPYVV